jgi:hypothetical protein
MCHGIDKRDLRELMGVTWTTTISPDVSEQRAAHMENLHREGKMPHGREAGKGRGKYRYSTAGLIKQKSTLDEVRASQAAKRSEREAEPVKRFETRSYDAFCATSSCGSGSLIHATVGSFGGCGRRWRNRSGFAA